MLIYLVKNSDFPQLLMENGWRNGDSTMKFMWIKMMIDVDRNGDLR